MTRHSDGGTPLYWDPIANTPGLNPNGLTANNWGTTGNAFWKANIDGSGTGVTWPSSGNVNDAYFITGGTNTVTISAAGTYSFDDLIYVGALTRVVSTGGSGSTRQFVFDSTDGQAAITVAQGSYFGYGVTGTIANPSPILLNILNLNVSGSSSFVVTNTSNTGVKDVVIPTFTSGLGDNVVGLTQSSTTGDLNLTFTNAFSNRLTGGTVNVVDTSTGTKPHAVRFSSAPATTGFIDAGTFFNGTNYAFIDSSTLAFRAMSYAGTDPNAGATFTADTHVLQTSSATTPGSISIRSLNQQGTGITTSIAGTLTLTTGGLLSSGGANAIDGGSGISTTAGGEYIVRVAGDNDTLAINTPLLANGSNILTKSGTGTLLYGTTMGHTGRTIVNGGYLQISSESQLGPSPASSVPNQLTFDGGGLRVASSLSLSDANRGIELGEGGGNFNVVNFADTLTISKGVTSTAGAGVSSVFIKSGPGTVTLTGTAANSMGSVNVNEGLLSLGKSAGVDALAGPVTIASSSSTTVATVKLLAGNQIASIPLTINASGVFEMNGFSETVAQLSGSGAVMNSGAAAATLGLDGTVTTVGPYSGAITDSSGGAVSVVKTGAGTATFSGANTYRGTTTVNGGVLSITGSHNGGGAYAIGVTLNGATPTAAGTLAGTGTISTNNADVVVQAPNGSFFPKLSPGVGGAGTLTFALGSGTLNLSPATNSGATSAALVYDLNAVSTSDRITVTSGNVNLGTLDFGDFAFTPLSSFGAGQYTLLTSPNPMLGSLGTTTGSINGLNATLSLSQSGTSLVLDVVPEPATFGVGLIGGLGLLARRRRRAGVVAF